MTDQVKLVEEVGPRVGVEYPLDAEVLRLGREHARTIPIDDPSVSRRHAEITCQPEGAVPESAESWSIADLDSRNGTFVNGERVVGARRLSPGDRIRVGETLFRLESVAMDRRFHNRLAGLIALAALTGALIAWRATVASGAAGAADATGIGALLRLTASKASIAAETDQNLDAVKDYSWRRVAARGDADAGGTDFEQERRYRKLASVARRSTYPLYLQMEPAVRGAEVRFDAERYGSARAAEDAANEDLDFARHFAAGDRARLAALLLSASTIILGAAVFLYTAARVSVTRRRRIAAGAGIGLHLLASLLAVGAETVLR